MSVSKESMVVWDGIIVADPVAGSNGHFNVKWTGTIIPHLSAADPSAVPDPVRRGSEVQVASGSEFSVSGVAKPADGVAGDKFKRYLVSFTEGDGFDLNGAKHKDTQHDVLCSLQWRGSPDGSDSLVCANGKDEYGSFISTGYMKPGNRITLARRYLDGGDSRVSLSPEDVHKEIIKAIYDEEEEDLKVSPPWKCDVLKA